MAEKKRIVWIDQLRAIAFYFVGLGHLNSYYGPLNVWIYSFHMPMFFLISGLNLNITKIYNTKFKDYFLHLVQRMLVPYFWLQLISTGIKYFTFRNEVSVFKYFLGMFVGNNRIFGAASNAMYFVLVLFLAQVCFWFVIRGTKANKIHMCLILAILSVASFATQNADMPWHLNVVPTGMAFMFIGRLLMDGFVSAEESLEKIKKPLYFGIGAALLTVGYFLARYNGRISIHANFYGKNYLVFLLSAVISFAGFAFIIMKIPSVKLLSFIGKNTLFFLGIHEPFLVLVRDSFPQFWGKWWFIAVASVVCYLLPVPLAWLFNRFAPYVCGIPPKQSGLPFKIGKYVTVALSFAACYISFLILFFDGVLIKNGIMKFVCAISYAAVVFGIERLFSLVLPFFLLQSKKKQPLAQADTYTEDGVAVIIPVEEV